MSHNGDELWYQIWCHMAVLIRDRKKGLMKGRFLSCDRFPVPNQDRIAVLIRDRKTVP